MRYKIIFLAFCFSFSILHSYALQSEAKDTTYTTYSLNKHKLFVASSLEGILFAGIQGRDSQNCFLDGGVPLKNGSLKCGIYSLEVHNGKIKEKPNLLIQTSFNLKSQEAIYEYPNYPDNRISILFQCSTNNQIQQLLQLMYQKQFSCQSGRGLFYEEAKNSMQEYIKNANTDKKEAQELLKYSPLEDNVMDALVYFDDELLVFERSSYLYTGGAHGMPTKEGIIISKNQGLVPIDKTINLNSHKLKTLLWEKYQEYLKKLPKETPPPQTYINFEDFKVSSAILLDYDGLIFLYQPYEILPYSYGIIRLKIPFIALKDDFKNSIFEYLLTTNKGKQ